MNDVRVDRCVVVQMDGEVEEFFSLTITNAGDKPFDLNTRWLTFVATDSITSSLISVSDGLNGHPAFESGPLNGEFVVAVKGRGAILPSEQRTVGVHLRRFDRAWVESNEIRLDDPTFLADVAALNPNAVTAHVTVVFPQSETRRSVSAANARFITSRAAEWDFPLSSDRLVHIRAAWKDGFAHHSLRRIDDVHASLSIAVGRATTGEAVALDQLRLSLATLSEPIGDSSNTALLPDVSVAGTLRESLSEALEIVRKRRLTGEFVCPPPSSEVTRALSRVMTEVQEQLGAVARTDSAPDQLVDTLADLIAYSEHRRKLGSIGWTIPVKEKQFQDRLYEFLSARGGEVGREAVVGNGRVDFVLRDTPVELKVQELGDTPRTRVLKHAQQAAEYASLRHRSVGVLMVLDVSQRSGGAHGAWFEENIIVQSIPNSGSLSGSSQTVVVAFSIAAFPPKPSSLGP